MSEKTVRILCLALAEYARIEAMKATNAARNANGEALAYTYADFGYSAETLEQLAQEVMSNGSS